MQLKPLKLTIASSLMLLFSCGSKSDLNYGDLEAFTEAGTVRCVIEIPAGTNKKIEYRDKQNDFKIDVRDGRDRVIDFLPYPANYGFIPSTESRLSEGGDGDHLDVLVLSESLETGTVIEAIPIAVLKLLDEGENDFKIICIPKEISKQIIPVNSLKELNEKYPGIIEVLNTWFTNYDRKDTLEILGWGDEMESLIEIEKSVILSH